MCKKGPGARGKDVYVCMFVCLITRVCQCVQVTFSVCVCVCVCLCVLACVSACVCTCVYERLHSLVSPLIIILASFVLKMSLCPCGGEVQAKDSRRVLIFHSEWFREFDYCPEAFCGKCSAKVHVCMFGTLWPMILIHSQFF